MNVEDHFRFKENKTGVIITEYLQKENPEITELEIPARYNNRDVYMIGGRAFLQAIYLKSISLPENLLFLDMGAFADCTSLENVALPNLVMEIRGATFCRCYALKSIVLPPGLNKISFGAFADCINLETVVFTGNKSVKILEDAFKNCSKLPPEFQIYSLVGYNNIDLPFRNDICDEFDWDLAMEENVFKTAIKHNNFSEFKEDLFMKIVDLNSLDHLTQAEHLLDEDLINNTLDYSIKRQTTEITAYLLDLKNRKFGFEEGGSYEL